MEQSDPFEDYETSFLSLPSIQHTRRGFDPPTSIVVSCHKGDKPNVYVFFGGFLDLGEIKFRYRIDTLKPAMTTMSASTDGTSGRLGKTEESAFLEALQNGSKIIVEALDFRGDPSSAVFRGQAHEKMDYVFGGCRSD